MQVLLPLDSMLLLTHQGKPLLLLLCDSSFALCDDVVAKGNQRARKGFLPFLPPQRVASYTARFSMTEQGRWSEAKNQELDTSMSTLGSLALTVGGSPAVQVE